MNPRTERLGDAVDLGQLDPGDQIGQHGDRRLRDAAALAFPGDGPQHPGGSAGDRVDLDPQRDLVTAGRIDLVGLADGEAGRGADVGTQAAPVRVLRMVQDDLLVQLLHRTRHAVGPPWFSPKNGRTPARASRNASISSTVV